MDSIIFTTLAAAPGAGAPAWISVLPLVAIFIIFYFLLIRPQQKRMKDHQDKIAGVKRGDQVVTGGGLMGKVTKVDDDYVELDLGGGTKVKAVKSTLGDIVPPGGKAAND
ncbi:preprotein translocase subunit YajC [Alterisphingorhabdus coralli]|uniref:Sec translocon accessory complex subunit YajC n=1 Tax=Alterisphingorhabdus coralli TaxID=3071408 RepID=A0AA97HZ71_9SPHN|nr:preprotein translocase subunit YajC [Parasphingorhabdus sp. SCSIO 66989]WOE74284.1 preprotein translocase subunit YajC [Parasphingorhabdus sp. SCSIO 66989]